MGAQTEIREADTVGNEATMNRLTPGCAIVPVEPQDLAVGRPFSEDILLRLGHAFQSNSAWHLRQPKDL